MDPEDRERLNWVGTFFRKLTPGRFMRVVSPPLPGLLGRLIGQVQALGPVLPNSPLLWVLGTVRVGILDLCVVNVGDLFHRNSRLHADSGLDFRQPVLASGW